MQYEQSFGRALRTPKTPELRNYSGGTRINSVNNIRDAEHRMKTFEIREILMEGHTERELLTPASTGS